MLVEFTKSERKQLRELATSVYEAEAHELAVTSFAAACRPMQSTMSASRSFSINRHMSLGLVDRGGKLSQLLALGLRELDKHFKVAPRA